MLIEYEVLPERAMKWQFIAFLGMSGMR